MNRLRTLLRYGAPIICVIGGGLAAFFFVPADMWVRCSSGLFVVLSVLAAAVLVRLARPSPFSNPDAFTDENVERYFSALIAVGKRLAVILAADFLAILALVVVIAFQPSDPLIQQGFSSTLGAVHLFLVMRMCSVVAGDLGFIGLQRRIVLDARKQKAIKAANVIVEGESKWRSAGGYG